MGWVHETDQTNVTSHSLKTCTVAEVTSQESLGRSTPEFSCLLTSGPGAQGIGADKSHVWLPLYSLQQPPTDSRSDSPRLPNRLPLFPGAPTSTPGIPAILSSDLTYPPPRKRNSNHFTRRRASLGPLARTRHSESNPGPAGPPCALRTFRVRPSRRLAARTLGDKMAC